MAGRFRPSRASIPRETAGVSKRDRKGIACLNVGAERIELHAKKAFQGDRLLIRTGEQTLDAGERLQAIVELVAKCLGRPGLDHRVLRDRAHHGDEVARAVLELGHHHGLTLLQLFQLLHIGRGAEPLDVPLARLLPPRATLVTSNVLAADIAEAGARVAAATVVTLDAVERLFGQLVISAQRRAWPGEPRLGARAATYLLILRELMHHTGFDRFELLGAANGNR